MRPFSPGKQSGMSLFGLLVCLVMAAFCCWVILLKAKNAKEGAVARETVSHLWVVKEAIDSGLPMDQANERINQSLLVGGLNWNLTVAGDRLWKADLQMMDKPGFCGYFLKEVSRASRAKRQSPGANKWSLLEINGQRLVGKDAEKECRVAEEVVFSFVVRGDVALASNEAKPALPAPSSPEVPLPAKEVLPEHEVDMDLYVPIEAPKRQSWNDAGGF